MITLLQPMTSPELSKGFAMTSLAIRILVAAFFVFMAIKNLSGDAQMASDFARWGYPPWFGTLTAALQVLGAVLLLVPATTIAGAVLLAGILVGATVTHVLHDPPAAMASPLVVLTLVLVAVWPLRPAVFR